MKKNSRSLKITNGTMMSHRLSKNPSLPSKMPFDFWKKEKRKDSMDLDSITAGHLALTHSFAL
jgi:hypothetical protein